MIRPLVFSLVVGVVVRKTSRKRPEKTSRDVSANRKNVAEAAQGLCGAPVDRLRVTTALRLGICGSCGEPIGTGHRINCPYEPLPECGDGPSRETPAQSPSPRPAAEATGGVLRASRTRSRVSMPDAEAERDRNTARGEKAARCRKNRIAKTPAKTMKKVLLNADMC